MTSNSQGQHLLHGSQRLRKSSAWSAALGIVLLGVVLLAPAEAAVFTVNNPTDPLPDAMPGGVRPDSGVLTINFGVTVSISGVTIRNGQAQLGGGVTNSDTMMLTNSTVRGNSAGGAVPGDYDGDGKADLAVYRDGVWFVLQSSNGGVTSTGWGGLAQDIPLNRRND